MNGIPQEDHFIELANHSLPRRVLAKGEIFVVGDNRNHSFDSKDWGVIKKENVIGRVLFSL